jgi:transposase
LAIDNVYCTEGVVHIQAHSLNSVSRCPDCQQPSDSIHSHYTRSPQDLPSVQRQVRLELQVQRFRCRNSACRRRTFVERLPEFVPFYGRRTHRLSRTLRAVGLAVGAEVGARIGRDFGVQVSGDTLLRVLRQTPSPAYPEPLVVGIDDWAFKKGSRYGTILVDLERHSPIDVLPSRQQEAVTNWFRQHPGITLIARDRSQEYAQAATQGAPQAIQVADRWHLLKNLGDALQEVLEKHSFQLRQWAVQEPLSAPLQAMDMPRRRVTRREQQQATLRRRARQERFAEVHQLHQQGWPQVSIARHLRLSTTTVHRYLAMAALPEHSTRQRTSQLDPYKPYLLERWNQGCHNAVQLRREIREQGYPGCVTQVRDYVARLRQVQKSQPQLAASLLPPVLSAAPLTPRRAAYLLLNPDDENEAVHRLFLKQFFTRFPEVRTLAEHFQAFARLVREQQVAALDAWLRQALQTDCPSLKQFARGIQKDEAAVRAALSMTWSNGQAEGQINRLKLIKRQRYGRAKFDLLRLRVLHPP